MVLMKKNIILKELNNQEKTSTSCEWVSTCPAGKVWDGVWEHWGLKKILGVFCEVLSFLLTGFWGTCKPLKIH